MRLAVLLFALMLAVVAPSFANGPTMMNYQAVFTDQDGNIMPDGVYEVGFHIYTGAFGGPPIWSEWDSVTVVNGVFEVTLGWGHPLMLSDFPAEGAWLGLSYDDVYMTPRQFIAAVPYAFYSCFADTARIADSARVAGNTSSGGFKQVYNVDDGVVNDETDVLSTTFATNANSVITFFATAVVDETPQNDGVVWSGRLELLDDFGQIVAFSRTVKNVAPGDLFCQSLQNLPAGTYSLRLTLWTNDSEESVWVDYVEFDATWIPAVLPSR
ncbi:MAG: hypothetical protein KDB65_02180 [Calditrichaeota bacterium]|nr:hypothetical protein [Calditrichota bacterium]MCB9369937.1 hypothetical protein [Calditrichota bacterium]